MSKEEAAALTEHIDLNKNGTIQYKEFVTVFFSRWRQLKRNGKVVDDLSYTDDSMEEQQDSRVIRYSGDSLNMLILVTISSEVPKNAAKCCNLFSPNLKLVHLDLRGTSSVRNLCPIYRVICQKMETKH